MSGGQGFAFVTRVQRDQVARVLGGNGRETVKRRGQRLAQQVAQVQALARAALAELAKKGAHKASEVFDFVDDYVKKNGGKKDVRWNSKSYPD